MKRERERYKNRCGRWRSLRRARSLRRSTLLRDGTDIFLEATGLVWGCQISYGGPRAYRGPCTEFACYYLITLIIISQTCLLIDFDPFPGTGTSHSKIRYILKILCVRSSDAVSCGHQIYFTGCLASPQGSIYFEKRIQTNTTIQGTLNCHLILNEFP